MIPLQRIVSLPELRPGGNNGRVLRSHRLARPAPAWRSAAMTFRRLIPIAAALLVGPAAPRLAACPACSPQGQTLASEIAQADFILYGTLKNPQPGPGGFNQGTTDLDIDLVIKPHDLVRGKKTITIPRYIPIDPKAKLKHLIFFLVNPVDGKIDPYRGEAVRADSQLPEGRGGAVDRRSER